MRVLINPKKEVAMEKKINRLRMFAKGILIMDAKTSF